MIDKLRDEIIESQKVRTDLLKWKLIIVSALGMAAVGVGAKDEIAEKPPIMLLALIPIVCLYVDVVCFHSHLRIMAIAKFLRTELDANDLARKYEEYCTTNRIQFHLEEIALLYTTVSLTLIVGLLGFNCVLKTLLVDMLRRVPPESLSEDFLVLTKGVFRSLGLGTLGVELASYHRYKKLNKQFDT